MKYLESFIAGDIMTEKRAKRLGCTHKTKGGNYVRLVSGPVQYGQPEFDMTTIEKAL